MEQEAVKISVRRILVALDASPHSQAALAAAVELAARFDAELIGLFVEDIALLHLAEAPFAREIGLYAPARQPLNAAHVLRQFRARAERVQQALQRAATRAQVRWTFQVTRGPIIAEVLAAASAADLVILGKAGWSLTLRGHLGSTARAVLAEAPCPALALRRGIKLETPIRVMYDGSPLAQKALAAALALAVDDNAPLSILILAATPAAGRVVQAQAEQWRQTQNVEAYFSHFSNARQLTDFLQSAGQGTLVLPARSAMLSDEALLTLLDAVGCPTLLIR